MSCSAHRPMDQRPSGKHTGMLAAGLAGLLEQTDVIDGKVVRLTLGTNATRELRATADGSPFVIKLARRHVPAAVDFADHRVVTEFEVVEELLAEFDRTVDLLDAPQGDARTVDWYRNIVRPSCLGTSQLVRASISP